MNINHVIKTNAYIFVLLIIAGVLRLYGLFHLQYIFDELCTINISKFSSFNEVVRDGIMTDNHPALIPLFIYYYSHVFGTAEWLIKLPFIFSGIISVYVIFTICKKWFNQTSGIFAAIILTCSQFFLFYSVTARPYISGLLITLLLLKYWLDILFEENPPKRKFILFAILAALSALNHHFSLLFAAVCGVYGLFLLSKHNYKKYLLACAASVLLYAPHIPILLHQFNRGGIGASTGGWLNPPNNDFLWDFVFYIFHYSYMFLGIFIAAILVAYFLNKPCHTNYLKLRLALFMVFISTFLIGFLYSLYVNPVIQFSTLMFSSPCLLIFMVSFAGELSPKFKWLFGSLILFAGLYSLIVNRHYYSLIFNQPIDTYVKVSDEIIKEKGNQNVYSIYKGEDFMFDFYRKKYNSNARFNVIEIEKQNLKECNLLYDTLSSSYLVLGGATANSIAQASIYFPYVYQKILINGTYIYVLSKNSKNEPLANEFEKIATLDLKNTPKNFTLNQTSVKNTTNLLYYNIDSLSEFPLSYKTKIKDLKLNVGQSIVAKISYKSKNAIKGLLCISIDNKGINKHWTANELDVFYNASFDMQTAYVSIYASENVLNPEYEMTAFIWNNQKEKLQVYDFKICKMEANPYLFGILSKY